MDETISHKNTIELMRRMEKVSYERYADFETIRGTIRDSEASDHLDVTFSSHSGNIRLHVKFAGKGNVGVAYRVDMSWGDIEREFSGYEEMIQGQVKLTLNRLLGVTPS